MHSFRTPVPPRYCSHPPEPAKNMLILSQSIQSGIFAEEILPVEIRGAVVSVDDTVRPGVTLESLAKLKPVFAEDGSTTAGNASGVGDGAALCFLTTRDRAEREGWDIVGKYVASTFVGTCMNDIPPWS